MDQGEIALSWWIAGRGRRDRRAPLSTHVLVHTCQLGTVQREMRHVHGVAFCFYWAAGVHTTMNGYVRYPPMVREGCMFARGMIVG